MSRHFERDFATDNLVVAAGGLTGQDGGPITIGLCFRLDQVSDGTNLMRARTAASGTMWQALVFSGQMFFIVGGNFRGGASVSTNTWYLYFATKANGSAVAREHLCDMSTDVWTHADLGSAMPDAAGAVDSVIFSDPGTDRLDGFIAASAVWDSVLTDLQIEGLRSGLSAWVSTSPQALWRFNDTPVNDLTAGGANQTAITGTTVDTGVEPPSFSYSLAGPTTGTLTGTLPELTSAATGRAVNRSTLAGSLPELTGQFGQTGTPALTASGTAPVLTAASGTAPALTASGTAPILAATGTP
jgi:hypothetical protein